jgi:hypothetical protein
MIISSFRCSGLIEKEEAVRCKEPGREHHGALLSLNTLRQLGRHTRIHFHRSDMLGFFEDSNSEIASTRPDLKYLICWSKVGLYL